VITRERWWWWRGRERHECRAKLCNNTKRALSLLEGMSVCVCAMSNELQQQQVELLFFNAILLISAPSKPSKNEQRYYF
jgi:hypothetical protein